MKQVELPTGERIEADLYWWVCDEKLDLVDSPLARVRGTVEQAILGYSVAFKRQGSIAMCEVVLPNGDRRLFSWAGVPP